jgi:hypothetical protein
MSLTLLAGTVPAAAQTVPSTDTPSQSSGPAVRLFSDSAFHMGVEHLASDSQDFVWEGNFGGRVDFLDWGRGRATFVANYQVIMGEEFKAFDPNQGNYILGFSGGHRIGRAEVSGVFHHESRHLSDRFKMQPVDWNMVGGRVTRQLTVGALRLHVEGQLLGVIQKSFVDYEWEADGGLRGDFVLRPGIGVLMNLDLRLLGVDGSRDRGTQTGVRAEGGIRIDGERAALELFVAGEGRIDPALLELGRTNFAMVGFRLLSR